MSNIVRNIILIFSFCASLNVSAFSNTSGHIKGTLLLDDSWERRVYVSLIETIEKKYAVSDNMIIGSSPLDSIGRFTIELNNLQKNWCFLRLHIVKKGNPPASLIIGGSDENYHFIIANRYSKIELQNTNDKPVFNMVEVAGTTYMSTLEYIEKLSKYPNSINYENSLIEKVFIEEVVRDKLKLIADTCMHPLVSLYALYQIDFQSDYEKDPIFYKTYLSKWENNSSPYFKSFRRQFPDYEKDKLQYILILFFIGIVIFVSIFIKTRKGSKIKTLSVQERKVFELLQKGASNQEISDEYNIEISTVKSHVSNIFSKLNIKARKEAINLKVR